MDQSSYWTSCEFHKCRRIEIDQLRFCALSFAPMSTENSNEHSLYELIGGDAQIRTLVDRFYDLMDLELEFKQVEFEQSLSFPFSVPKNYKPKL